MPSDGAKEACKTFIDQTKLLVTLASAFIVAPAAMVTLFKGTASLTVTRELVHAFIGAESSFVLSVFLGYWVLATIAGTQYTNEYNLYRPATRLFSILQILAYVVGLGIFMKFMLLILEQT